MIYDLQECFQFLDDIRAEGSINMFGARPVLAMAFGLDSKTAGKVLSSWMTTFDSDKSAAERATMASAE